MIRAALSLGLLTFAGQAYAGGAGLLGTDIEFFFFSDVCGVLSATVVDPGVEFAGVGPELCMAGDTQRYDSDITNNSWRIESLVEQDIGCGGGLADEFTLREITPTCPPGQIGVISSLTSVTTNMETDEWIPSQAAFSDNEVYIQCDAAALGGDDPNNIRWHPGDFIEIEMAFSCVGSVAPSLSLIGGPCPSLNWDMDFTGFTPGSPITILKGTGPGSDALAGGPCVGVTTGLAGMSLVTTVTADSSGNFSANPTLGGQSCGKWIQGVDLATCSFTAPIAIP